MANEDFEQFEDPYDELLKRKREGGVSRRRSLQPIAYKGGVPSAEKARTSGLTSAAFVNLLAPQDFSGTGATGSADTAIRNTRRIKRDRQVAQLLATLGGQQLQEEGATARSAADNLTKLKVAGLSRQTALDTAEAGQKGSLEKQKLIGSQGLEARGLAEQAALDRLKFQTEAGKSAQERSFEEGRTAALAQDERARTRENQARAFELFKGGDVEGAQRLAGTGTFTPSYKGLTPPGESGDFKFIPGQKSSVKGVETLLPGKVLNVRTGDVQTDLSDLSPEERDALLKILENRETQGLN